MIHGGSRGGPSEPGQSPEERERRNRSVLLSFAMVCGLVLILASGLPGALVAPALGQLFGIASIGAALVAIFWREPLTPAHFTHWDKSAALLGLSILAGMFADPVLVEQTLNQLTSEQDAQTWPGLGTAFDAVTSPGAGATTIDQNP